MTQSKIEAEQKAVNLEIENKSLSAKNSEFLQELEQLKAQMNKKK